jgi:hypothetical protein
MKKLILLIVLIPCLAQAQDIIGKWNGILSVKGMELRLVFHISREDSTFVAKMDSPDQKAFGITTSVTNFENSTLNIDIAKLGQRIPRHESFIPNLPNGGNGRIHHH